VGGGRAFSKAMLALAHRQPSVIGGHTLLVTRPHEGEGSEKEGGATQLPGGSSGSLVAPRAHSILLRPDGG
jgi:hypothetical protein